MRLLAHAVLATIAVLIAAACSPEGQGLPPTASPLTTAPAVVLETPHPSISLRPVEKATLKGQGDKIGPVVVLSGDYVFRDSVKTKAGCRFQVYLDGLDDQPLDVVETDSAGSNSTEADELGLDLRTYTLRVVATKCGAWSASLTKK
jgi:hypothetical protein